MKIVATEFYRKGNLLPFISWKVDSATAFGDHHVKFDLRNRRVIRASDDHSKDIATIEPGHIGSILRNFYGTVDSDTFKVTKSKKDWLSALTGNALFEVTIKDSGQTITNIATSHDFYSTFRVGDLLRLKLSRDDRRSQFRQKIEGTCDDKYQDLAEILASLLLHQSEEQSSAS